MDHTNHMHGKTTLLSYDVPLALPLCCRLARGRTMDDVMRPQAITLLENERCCQVYRVQQENAKLKQENAIMCMQTTGTSVLSRLSQPPGGDSGGL